MRQVNEAELLYNLGYALKRVPPGALRDLASGERMKRERAIAAAARQIAAVLNRYEVLSPAPLTHYAGDDLFKPGLGRGEVVQIEDSPILRADL